MNDFGVNITGFVGVVKPRSFHLPAKPTTEDLSFKIESGSGCSPEKGTRRTIKGRWLSDNAPDTINSHDFSYVIDKDGAKMERLPEEIPDIQPVQLASEKPTVTKVRRGKS